MAHLAGIAATGAFEVAAAFTPTTTMGVITAGTADGAVTLDADIATRVTGLTSVQVASGFTGMALLPIMETGGGNVCRMTAIAVGLWNRWSVVTLKVASAAKVSKETQVRRTVCPIGATNPALKIGVAIGTELRFMATGAGLLIAAGGQGVGNVKITGVTVHHVVTEGALLIGKAGDVAFHAVTLRVADGTIHGVSCCHAAVVASPHGAVGIDGSESGHFHIKLVMTHEAGFGRRNNAGRFFRMAGAAIHAVGIHIDMCFMIKSHPLRPGNRDAEQEQREYQHQLMVHI